MGESWKEKLIASGFDAKQPAIVASTGVAMYLSKKANLAALSEIATMAPGSQLAMTFLVPMEMAGPEERAGRQAAEKGARASGTPFLSFFTPEEMLDMAREAGFKKVQHVSAKSLDRRYFANRTDGLHLSGSEQMLLAAT